MGKLKSIRRVFIPSLHLKRWLNIDDLKKNKQFITETFSDTTNTDTVFNEETSSFSEYIKKLDLDEQQLIKKATTSKQLSYIYAAMGIALFLYGLWILLKLFILPGITCFVFSALLFVYAFRENIFYFQIKNQQLKVPLNQWAKQLFSGK